MLSADGVSAAALDGVEAALDSVAPLVERLENSDAHLGQGVAIVWDVAPGAAAASEKLTGLFGSLTPEDFTTPESLLVALDELPGTTATLAPSSDSELLYELDIAGEFTAEVPLVVNESMVGESPAAAGPLVFDSGTVFLSGTWQLDLSLGARADGAGFTSFIKASENAFGLSFSASSPLVTTGSLGPYAFTADVYQLDLNANIQLDLVDPEGFGELNVEELTTTSLDLLATARVDGHAALAAKLVTSLDAPNPPPRLGLGWQNLNVDTASVNNLEAVGEALARTSVRVEGPETPFTHERGGHASFTVALTRAPTAEVHLDVSSSDPSEITVSPSTLTFTPETWPVAQQVTLRGIDDGEADGHAAVTVALSLARSADATFAGVEPLPLSLVNLDVEPLAGVALDVDADGKVEPLVDGLLILMYLGGERGEALTERAPGLDATRGAIEIEAAIEALLPLLDVEIDGVTSSLSDPRTVLEYLFGVDVAVLIDDARSSQEVSWRALEVGRRSRIAGVGSLVAVASRTDPGLDLIEFHGVSGRNQVTLGDFRGESGAWQLRYKVAEGDYRTDFDPFQAGVQPLFLGSRGLRVAISGLGLTLESLHSDGGDVVIDQSDGEDIVREPSADSDSITISGVLDARSLDPNGEPDPGGTSGDITISAEYRDDFISIGPGSESITLQDAALYGKVIEITATRVTGRSQRQILGFDDNQTSIAITDSTIEADASIEINAHSEDLTYGDDRPLYGNYFQGLVDRLVDGLVPLPRFLGVFVRQASSSVLIQGSTLTAEGYLKVKTKAISHAVATAIAGLPSYLNKKVGGPEDPSTVPRSRLLNSFSFGLTSATGTSSIEIDPDAPGAGEISSTLTSRQGDVKVTAQADVASSVTARTTQNINEKAPAATERGGGAVGITLSDTTATATIGAGASISAPEGRVTFEAVGDVENTSSATSATYNDGTAGLTVAVGVDDTTITTTVDGELSSGVEVSSSKAFDTSSIEEDVTIFLPGHGFQDGERVAYRPENPADPAEQYTAIGGLFSGEELLVRVIDEDRLQLFREHEIDLRSTGGDPGSLQSISLFDVLSFDPQSQLDVESDTITLAGHPFVEGQAVEYSVRPPTDERPSEPIGGLEDGSTYYVMVEGLPQGQFRLAESVFAVEEGRSLDLAYPDSGRAALGTEHYLVYESESRFFSPQSALDEEANTITVDTSGIDTGRAILYRTDPAITSSVVLPRDYGFSPEGVTARFDPTGTINRGQAVVDSTAGALTIQNHGWQTGDAVVYDALDSAPILEGDDDGVLISGATYYVILVDANTVQLASSLSDALVAEALKLADGGESEEQELRHGGSARRFQPSATIDWEVIDLVADSVLFETPHGLVTGQRLTYTTGEDANGQPNLPIGGVESDLDYYAIALSDFELRLAKSREEAFADVRSNAIQVAVVAGGVVDYDSGFKAIVQQLNDDTYYDFEATLVQPSDIDSPDELNNYQVVVIGGSGDYRDEPGFSGFQTPLRNWVEAGGGLVMTGWGVYAAHSPYHSDLDAVVPVDLSSPSLSVTPGQVSIIQSHPVTDSVGSFSLSADSYVEYSRGGAQGTVLGTTTEKATVVVDEPVAGRSVYLGPLYGSAVPDSELRSGDPDRLLENSVAWAAPRTAIDLQPGATGSASALHEFSGHSVDVENDWIVSPGHELETGQAVSYEVGDGTAIGGLTDGETYYAVRLDANTLRLADSIEDASTSGRLLDQSAEQLDVSITNTVLMQAFRPAGTDVVAASLFLLPGASPRVDLTIELYQSLPTSADSLLARGTVRDVPTNQWATVVFDEPVSVNPGSTYYLGFSTPVRGSINDPYPDGQMFTRDGDPAYPLFDLAFRTYTSGSESSNYRQLDSTGTGTLQTLSTDAFVFPVEAGRIGPVVDIEADTIELPGHGLSDGQRVSYQASGGEAIGGLSDNTEYVVLTAGLEEADRADFIQLATLDVPSVAIDLSSTGTIGSGPHAFRVIPAVDIYNREDPVLVFDPTLVAPVDLANDTIRVPGHGLSTGDRLHYLSGGGDPIGGLVNGSEYFAIVISDSVLQLAGSPDDAATSDAVPLSAGASGDRHGIQIPSTVTQSDLPIGGLGDGVTYYAIVDGPQTLRLARSPQEAFGAVAQVLSPSETEAGSVHTLEAVDDVFELSVRAELQTAKNTQNAGTLVGSAPTFSDLLMKGEVLFSKRSVDFAKGFYDLFATKAPNPAPPGPANKKGGYLVAGVAVNSLIHKVQAIVNGTLTSSADIEVYSGVSSQKVQTKAQGNVVMGSGKKFVLSAGFAWSEVENNAWATIGGGAEINATGKLEVQSKIEYPLLVGRKALIPFSFYDCYDADDNDTPCHPIKDLAAYTDGSLGLSRVLNTWANSKAFTPSRNNLPDYAFTFSIGVGRYANVSRAVIASGARINQDGKGHEESTVEVRAETDTTLVALAGIMQLRINEDAGFKADQKRNEDFNSIGNALSFTANKSASFGLGFSYMEQILSGATTATIEEGALVKSGSGGVRVEAHEYAKTFNFTQSGADSEGGGIAASVGITRHDDGYTVARVGNGVQIDTSGVPMGSEAIGALTIRARSEALHSVGVGGFAFGDTVGIGLSAGTVVTERQTGAFLGDLPEADVWKNPNGASQDDVSSAPDPRINVSALVLDAENTGQQTTVSVVGSFSIDNHRATGAWSRKAEPRRNSNSKFHFGFAGDTAVNVAEEYTRAQVDFSGDVNVAGLVDMDALNDTEFVAVSGAFAISWNTGKRETANVAVAAAIAWNDLVLETEATMASQESSAAPLWTFGSLDMAAKSSGNVFAVTASLGVASGSRVLTLNGVFSLGWNDFVDNVHAYLNEGYFKVTGSADLLAENTREIHADGGGAALTLGVGKVSVSIGASTSYNEVDMTVDAAINGGELTAGSVTIEARGSPTVEAWALAGSGKFEGGFGFGFDRPQALGLDLIGAFAFNYLTTVVKARIGDEAEDTDTTVKSTAGDVHLSASDISFIEATVGGGVLGVDIGRAAPKLAIDLGTALSWNEITDDSRCFAKIYGAKEVHAVGNLTVESFFAPEIRSVSVATSLGLAITGKKGFFAIDGVGSAAVNKIDGQTAAEISGSPIVSATEKIKLNVKMGDATSILARVETIKLQVSTSNTTIELGVGVAYANNEILRESKVGITGSTAHSAALSIDGEVNWVIDAQAATASAQIDLSRANSSVGINWVGVFVFNTTRYSLDACIENSAITTTTGNVSLSTLDKSKVEARTFAGEGDLTITTSGTSVTVNETHAQVFNELESSITSRIENDEATVHLDKTVDSGGDVTLAAKNQLQASAHLLSLSVDVTITSSGEPISLNAADSIAHNNSDTTVETSLSHATVEADGHVTLSSHGQPALDTTARAVGVAAAVGGKSFPVAINIGVVKSESNLNDDVTASIEEHSDVVSGGKVLLTALADVFKDPTVPEDPDDPPLNISSLAPSLSFSVAFSFNPEAAFAGLAGGFAISRSFATKAMTIKTSIADSAVTGTNRVGLHAIDQTRVKTTVKSIAAAGALISGAVALPKSEVTDTSEVTSEIHNAEVTSDQGSITMDAISSDQDVVSAAIEGDRAALSQALEDQGSVETTPMLEAEVNAVAASLLFGNTTSHLDVSYKPKVTGKITGSESNIKALNGAVVVSALTWGQALTTVKSHTAAVVAVVDVVDQVVESAPTVTANIGGDDLESQDLRVHATAVEVSAIANDLAQTTLRMGDGAVGLAISVANIDSQAKPEVTSRINGGAWVEGTELIDVRATSTSEAYALLGTEEDEEGDERALNVGGIASIAANDSRATVAPIVKVDVGEATLHSGGSIRIVARGGESQNPSDGTFDAANDVYVDRNVIDFGEEHGWGRGAIVEYDAQDNVPLGGLIDGQQYRVLPVDADEVKLGPIVSSPPEVTSRFAVVYSDDPLTWSAAASRATEYGGWLATVESAEENQAIVEILDERSDAWIGASDAQKNGNWRWSVGFESGRVFWEEAAALGEKAVQGAYSNWASGEPKSSFPGNNFAAIEESGDPGEVGADGQWRGFSAEQQLNYFVLEIAEPVSVDTHTDSLTFGSGHYLPGAAPDDAGDFGEDGLAIAKNGAWNDLPTLREQGYVLETGFDAAARYELVAFSGTWEAARQEAQRLGGDLAVIDSAQENAMIGELVLQSGADEAWTGASDITTEGDWKWVTGETFWQGGVDGEAVGDAYENWRTGEPNNYDQNEHYATIYSDGTWNDYFADGTRSHFVLELDVSEFTLVEGSYSQEEAREDATSRNGRLAEITTQAQQDAIEELLKEYQPDVDDDVHFWLGATDSEEEGNWSWLSSSHLFWEGGYFGKPAPGAFANFQTPVGVFYNSLGDPIGGLEEDKAYAVRVLDPHTVKLFDPDAPTPLTAPRAFSGADLDIDINDVQSDGRSRLVSMAGHGFEQGQPVTYRAPPALQFSSENVDSVLSTIDPQNDNRGVAPLLADLSQVIYSADTRGEDWYWITDPDKTFPQPFWTGDANGFGYSDAYENWRQGEPNNPGGIENYATVYPDGTWNNRAGSDVLQGYLLERPRFVRSDEAHSWSHWGNDYSSSQNYKWIATIQDQTEQDQAQAAAGGVEVWLGGSDHDDRSEWYWVQGPTQERVQFWDGKSGGDSRNNSYTHWAHGEPNDTGLINNETQLVMRGDGYWNDVSDDKTHYALFESRQFTFIQGSFTFEQARKDAESKGGWLATIVDESETDLVLTAMTKAGGQEAWIGASDSQLIEGLSFGEIYRVEQLVDDADSYRADSYRLKAKSGASVSVNAEGKLDTITHFLTRFENQPLGGLEDGYTYYVIKDSDDRFGLAYTPEQAERREGIQLLGFATDLDGNRKHIGQGGWLGTEGLDLTDTGSGRHRFPVDITSAGAGQHELTLIENARQVNVFRQGYAKAVTTGGGGGLVGVGVPRSFATAAPDVTVTIDKGADINAKNVTVFSFADANAKALSDSTFVGIVVESGNSTAEVEFGGKSDIDIQGKITATQDVVVRSHTSDKAEADAETRGGGAIPLNNSWSRIDHDYASTVELSGGALVKAGSQLTVEATSRYDDEVISFAKAGGLGGEAKANWKLGGDIRSEQGVLIGDENDRAETTVTIRDARLEGETIDLFANLHDSTAKTKAKVKGNGMVMPQKAEAQVIIYDEVKVDIGAGAVIEASETVNVSATHCDIKIESHSKTVRGFRPSKSLAQADYDSYSKVVADSGATVQTRNLLVNADQHSIHYKRKAETEHGSGNNEEENGESKPRREISWDADVLLRVEKNLRVTEDEFAEGVFKLETTGGISLASADRTFAAGEEIDVNPILFRSDDDVGLGRVVFGTPVKSEEAGIGRQFLCGEDTTVDCNDGNGGEDPWPDSVLSGKPTFRTLPTVELVNESPANLRLQGVDLRNVEFPDLLGGVDLIELDCVDNQASWQPKEKLDKAVDFSHLKLKKTFEASSGVGPDLTLSQFIDAGYGHVEIYNASGDILGLNGDSGTPSIRSGSLEIHGQGGSVRGGAEGSGPNPLWIQMTGSDIYAEHVQLEDPVAYWRLGESSGPTAVDSTAIRYDGVYGAGVQLGETGAIDISNTSARFAGTGSDSHVTVEGKLGLAGSRAQTVTGWFKVESLSSSSGWQAIYFKGEAVGGSTDFTNNGSNRDNTLWVNSSGQLHLAAATQGAGEQTTITTTSGFVTAGRWYHFASVLDLDDGQMVVYLNGKEVGTNPFSGSSLRGTANWFFGSNPSGGSELHGWLDEIAVYDSALSSGYIAKQFQVLEPPPVAFWRMNEAVGSVLLDSSSNGLDGNFSNVTLEQDLPVAGTRGTSARFTGEDDSYVEIVDTPVLYSPHSQAVLGWLKIDDQVHSRVVLADQPRAYWRLGEQSGAVLTDFSGNGNSGSYGSDVGLGERGAIFNGDASVRFDGASDSYARVADDPDRPSLGAQTVTGWVKINSLDKDWQALYFKGEAGDDSTDYRNEDQGGNRENTLWINRSGALYLAAAFEGDDAESVLLSDPNRLSVGAWHHFASVLDPQTNRMAIYLDGVEVASKSDFDAEYLRDTPGDWHLAQSPSGESGLDGWLDEIAVFDRALTSQEIFDQYTAVKEWQTVYWKGGEPDEVAGRTNRENTFWVHSSGFLYLAAAPEGGSNEIALNTDAGIVEPGRWQHFATVLDAEEDVMRIYLDGALQIESSFTADAIQDTTGPWRLGNNPSWSSGLNGWLDDVAIYDEALTDGQISQAYQFSLSGRTASQPLEVEAAGAVELKLEPYHRVSNPDPVLRLGRISAGGDLTLTLDPTYDVGTARSVALGYQFEHLEAGGNLEISGPAAWTGQPLVSVESSFGFSETDSGRLNAETNGSISLARVNSPGTAGMALAVDSVLSEAGSVELSADGGLVIHELVSSGPGEQLTWTGSGSITSSNEGGLLLDTLDASSLSKDLYDPGQSIAAFLKVETEQTIQSMSVYNRMLESGSLKFLIFAESPSHELVFESDPVTFDADAAGQPTWKDSQDFSFTLRAGQNYYVGAIPDVSAEWYFDVKSNSQNGITAPLVDGNFTNFSAPSLLWFFNGGTNASVRLRSASSPVITTEDLLLLGDSGLGTAERPLIVELDRLHGASLPGSPIYIENNRDLLVGDFTVETGDFSVVTSGSLIVDGPIVVQGGGDLSLLANGSVTHRLIDEVLPFNEARADASRRGGWVATVSNEPENAVVRNLAGGQRVWLGATDESIDGDWRWLEGDGLEIPFWSGQADGTAVDGRYYNWELGEPNNDAGDEDYLEMYASGTWNDLPSFSERAYVLEFPVTSIVIAAPLMTAGGEGQIDVVGRDGVRVETAQAEVLGQGQVVLSAGAAYQNLQLVDGIQAADIWLADGSSVTSEHGNVALLASRDVWLSQVRAPVVESESGGRALIVAGYNGVEGSFDQTRGAIRDNGSLDRLNVIGGAAILTAPGGSGENEAGVGFRFSPLRTQLGRIATFTDAGDISIYNFGGTVSDDFAIGEVSLELVGLFADAFDWQAPIVVGEAPQWLSRLSNNDSLGGGTGEFSLTGAFILDSQGGAVEYELILSSESDLVVSPETPVLNLSAGNIIFAALAAGDPGNLFEWVEGDFSYSEALADARQKGGSLARIDSLETQILILEELGTFGQEGRLIFGKWGWLGASDAKEEGNWIWTTCVATDASGMCREVEIPLEGNYTNWTDRDPYDGDGSYDYAVMNFFGRWQSADETLEVDGYLLQKPSPHDVQLRSPVFSAGGVNHIKLFNGYRLSPISVPLPEPFASSYHSFEANVDPVEGREFRMVLSGGPPIGMGIRYFHSLDKSARDAATYADGRLFPDSDPLLFEDDGRYAVYARVMREDGLHTDYKKNITVADVAPSDLALAGSSVPAAPRAVRTLSGTFEEVGIEDEHRVLIDWGDGRDETTIELENQARSFTSSHAYEESGRYVATVTVTDVESGKSTSSTTTFFVSGVALQDGRLNIIGTDDDDKVELRIGDDDIKVVARLSDLPKETSRFSTSEVEGIEFLAFSGEDRLRTKGHGTVPITVFGGMGDDEITTGRGNDRITDLHGDNVIRSGRGDDTVLSGDGDDRVSTSSGDDHIEDSGGDNRIGSGSGDDTVLSGFGDDRVSTGSGNDLIEDAGGDNRINTGSGDDTVLSGTGDDRVSTGSGNDWVEDTGGDNRINTGSGDDTVLSGDGDDRVSTGSGNDWVEDTGGDNRINTGSGDDTVLSGDGDDRVSTGSGNDYIEDTGGDNRIDTGSGDDTVLSGDGDDRVSTGSGNDYIEDMGGDNRIDTGSGDDTVLSGDGDDRVSTGSGNDRIEDSGGDNQINTGSGDDTVLTGAGDDRVSTGSGNDHIEDTGGDNRIETGSGDDTVLSGAGDDRVITGSGNDRIEDSGGDNQINTGSDDDTILSGDGDEGSVGS